MNLEEFMTTREVADLLRTSPDSVRWWRYVNRGPRSFKVGRRVLYARADVEQFIADQRAADEPDSAGDPTWVI